MHHFILRLLATVVCSLALPAYAASTPIDSLYTPLEGSSCKPLEDNAEEGWAKGRCDGIADYKLDWMEGDLRQSLNVIAPDGKEFPLELWSTVSSGFSALGNKAEWRVHKAGKQITPIALIVRFNVSENPDQPEKTTSYLTVSKITASEVCVTDVVKPGANANQQARDLADAASEKPCMKAGTEKQAQGANSEKMPSYLCKPDEQVVFGCHSKDKMISLCASPETSNGYLQYRFGTPDKIELEYPTQRTSLKGNFFHSFEPYSGGYSKRVRFENGKVQYIVFEDMISTGPASSTKEMHYGVGILMPGKKATSRLCDGSGKESDGNTESEGFIFDQEKLALDNLMNNEDYNFDFDFPR